MCAKASFRYEYLLRVRGLRCIALALSDAGGTVYPGTMVPGTAAAQPAPGGTDVFAMMDGASCCCRDVGLQTERAEMQ